MTEDTLLGTDEGLGEAGEQGGDAPVPDAAGSAPEYFVGEFSSDDVVNRLNDVAGFGESMKALESRAFGRLGSMEQMVRGLQETLPNQAKLDASKFTRLKEHDSDLAEALIADLQDALSLFAIDEKTLGPMLEKNSGKMGHQNSMDLIEAFHGDLMEFVPFEGQVNPRADGYRTWFASQDYQTQQALQNVEGPRAVRALNSFKEWEKKIDQEREKEAKVKVGRLAGGGQPASEKAPKDGAMTTEEQGFAAAFK